jgi:signal transduction histidine kinase
VGQGGTDYTPWWRKRLRGIPLWALGILATAALIARQHVSARDETEARSRRYAELLAQDVWNFDSENATRALHVLADAEQFAEVSVRLPDGSWFVRFKAARPSEIGFLTPERKAETPILRDGERLATLYTRGAETHLVHYVLEVIVLLLGGMLVQVAMQNAAHKRNLARLRLHNEITLREEVEARLCQREGELKRAQRLEALGQVAGGVAHDFNNLLTVIIGRIEVALLKHQDEKNLQVALEAADRAQAMTHRLLAFGNNTAQKPRVLDLNEVVRGMLEMLGHLLPAQITLETELATELPAIRMDVGQLEQVVLNLVVNARDAMPTGGVVRISTGVSEKSAQGKRVALSIRDTGLGMSEDVQNRVFEPFFTTKGAGEGTGLGLSTVSHIVQQSSAELSLTSSPGQGSTFTVLFKLASESSEDSAAADEPSARAGTQRARVLVVENDASLRLFVRDALEGFGVEVTTARDPNDALRMLQLSPSGVDLVLSDLSMPHMSGPALRELARQYHVKAPFVFMSSNGAGPVFDGDPVLKIPFSAADVRSAVKARLSPVPFGQGERS